MGDSGGNDIIIKGGSVELQFDETLYQKGSDPKVRTSTKNITQVVISGGGLTYDSGVHPEGLKCTIRVVCS